MLPEFDNMMSIDPLSGLTIVSTAPNRDTPVMPMDFLNFNCLPSEAEVQSLPQAFFDEVIPAKSIRKELIPLLEAAKETTKPPAKATTATSKTPGSKTRKPDRNVCETCHKSFDRLYNLKVHRRKHNGDKPYSCPMEACDKEFRWRSSMAHHVRAHHGGSAEDITRASRKADTPKRSPPKKSTDSEALEVAKTSISVPCTTHTASTPDSSRPISRANARPQNSEVDTSPVSDALDLEWDASSVSLRNVDMPAVSEETILSFLLQQEAALTAELNLPIFPDTHNT